jgi:hypothetical protein
MLFNWSSGDPFFDNSIMLLVGGRAHHLPSIKFGNTIRCREIGEAHERGHFVSSCFKLFDVLVCSGRTHHLGLVMTECIVTRKMQFSPVAMYGHFS